MVVSLLVALALTGPTDPEETCQPVAALTGDPMATRAVKLALEERGIESDPRNGCVALRVAVTHRNGALRVERADRAGRLGARFVATPETAALLIESWLRTDIAAPLLLAPDERFDDAPPALVPARPELPVPQMTELETLERGAIPAPASTLPGAAIALVGEAALDRGGWRAYGLGVASCVYLGPLCAGVAGHLARVSVAGDADVSRETGIYAADALIAAEMSWRVGSATVRPGAGVGAGWVGAKGDMREGRSDAFGLRAEARLAMDWTIGRGLAIEVAAAGGAAGSAAVHEIENLPAGRERIVLDHGLVPLVRAGLGIRFGAGP